MKNGIHIDRVDTSRWNAFMRRFPDELGQCASDVARFQTGKVMEELYKGASPTSLDKAKKSAERDVRRVFAPGATKDGTPYSLFPVDQRGQGDTVWLYAGKQFLVGVDAADFQPQLQGDQASKLYYESKNQSRGNKWQLIGRRGLHQQVQKIRRVLIRPSAFKALVKQAQGGFGKLKASWALGKYAAHANFLLPQWISKWIQNGGAKGGFINNLTDKRQPSFTIISEAVGCESDKSMRNVDRALKRREFAMAADLRNQINGAYTRANGYYSKN